MPVIEDSHPDEQVRGLPTFPLMMTSSRYGGTVVGGGQPVRQTVLYACTVSDLRPALIVLTSDFQSWEGMQCGGVKTCSIKEEPMYLKRL